MPTFWTNRGWRVAVAFAPTVAGGLAIANGGYFPTSWSRAALGFGWLAVGAIALGAPVPLRAAWMLGPLAALLVWELASASWAASAPAAVQQAEQTLAILFGLLAFFVLVRFRDVNLAFTAVVGAAGLVCAYALATRLFGGVFGLDDPVSAYRLSSPIGYWNGLGIYAACALAVAFGLHANAGRVVRAVAGFTIPILSTTTYFTYSRGAVIALGAGLLVAFALEQCRSRFVLRSVLVGALAGVGVLVASQATALTKAGASSSDIRTAGHRLAVFLIVLCLAAAAAAFIPERTFAVSRRTDRVVGVVVGGVCVVALALGLFAVGGPSGLWDKFSAPPAVTHGDLNARLFSFSGSYRTPLWRQALNEYEAHPLVGGGAGSYETYYLEHRVRPDKVRNAHNLYLETLAELGPGGLVLLLVALLAPFAFVWRGRHPLLPALCGGYVAFLMHMAIDWDWQLTGVAIAGLFLGAGIVISATSDESRIVAGRFRLVLLGCGAAGVVASFVVLAGNLSLARASNAAQAGDWDASARAAKRARVWAPWSSEPYRLLGEAELGQGESKDAVRSFRRAIAKSPYDWNLWFDLARATLGREQRVALDRAAKLNPLSPEVAEFRRELAQDSTITVEPNQS